GLSLGTSIVTGADPERGETLGTGRDPDPGPATTFGGMTFGWEVAMSRNADSIFFARSFTSAWVSGAVGVALVVAATTSPFSGPEAHPEMTLRTPSSGRAPPPRAPIRKTVPRAPPSSSERLPLPRRLTAGVD